MERSKIWLGFLFILTVGLFAFQQGEIDRLHENQRTFNNELGQTNFRVEWHLENAITKELEQEFIGGKYGWVHYIQDKNVIQIDGKKCQLTTYFGEENGVINYYCRD